MPLPHVTFAQHEDEVKLKEIAEEFKKNEFNKLPKVLRATQAHLTKIEKGYSTPTYKFKFKS